MPIPPLKHQALRDLAWMLFSPPLIDLPQEPDLRVFWPARDLDQQSLCAWLEQLDANPTALHDHLASLKSPRLGIYFEGLCAFFFKHFEGFELLAHNLQVNRELNGKHKQTLGEYDFIVRHKQQVLHIETAVKFYLGTGEKAEDIEASHWVGPNANDRLDKKVDRLLSHQLALSTWPEGKSRLREISVAQTKRCLFMAGYLFYPMQQHCPAPNLSHPQHCRGNWLTVSDLANLITSPEKSGSLWHVLSKKLWLGPAQIDLNDPPENGVFDGEGMLVYLQNYFSESESLSDEELSLQKRARLARNPNLTHRPLLLCELQEPSNALPGEDWREVERYFVVPDYWPATASPSRKT